ncbi:hypothetical protein HN385_07410 [archaeon]|jgi:predicted SAM-dependent methyltransferase|nr:hypothetical protein [archaeon]
MNKKILLTSIVYFNEELVKTHIDFLTSISDKADVIVLENPSDKTPEISEYCKDLVKQNKLYKYLLFDQNIGMNTFETLFNSSVVNINDYPYVIITDGDLIVEKSGWLEEQMYILDKYPDTYACGVKMSMENLPSIKLHPDANKWYPKSSKITKDYEDGETGLNFLMYKTLVLKQFLDFIRDEKLTLMDTTMHVHCNHITRLQWRRTRNSECYHLTWDLYKDLKHEYTKLKTTKTREEMWFHGNYCDYSVYENNSEGLITTRYSKYNKPELKVKKQEQSSLKLKKRRNIVKPVKRRNKKNNFRDNDMIEKANTNILKRKRITPSKSVKPISRNKKIINKKEVVTYDKLHIGCGNNYFKDNWLNIDLLNPKGLPLDIKYKSLNVLKQFPFTNVKCIYSEHFIEHLNEFECDIFIKNCFDSLSKDGVLRIATFDLDIIVDVCQSSNKNWRVDYCIEDLGLSSTITRGEFLNASFNKWYHKYIYNSEDLKTAFTRNGFENIKFCNIHESEHDVFKNLEIRFNSTLIIEGTK